MRHLLILLVISILNFAPGVIMAQPEALDAWYHMREGNNFDGFSLVAGVITDASEVYSDDGEAYFLLKVNNSTGSLEPLREESSSWQELMFQIRGVFDFKPWEVLMSFDESETVWVVADFFESEPDDDGIQSLYWKNFVSDDFEQFMSTYQFVRELKSRRVVHFRVQSAYHAKQDISFPLGGSSGAIDKCVSVPSKAPDLDGWRDRSIDTYWALVNWGGLKPSNMTEEDFSSLFSYLEEKLGYFYYMRVKSIDYSFGQISLYGGQERKLDVIDVVELRD